MIVLFWLALQLGRAPDDPAPGWAWTTTEARGLDCEQTTTEAADRRYPGRITTTPPRGDFVERDAVICRQRLTRPGLRAPLDEAVLGELDRLTGELATAAAGRYPELAGRTWLVEAHYPSAQVAAKVSFAAKNALAARGLAVSDRVPSLGPDDVGVITRLPPEEAYPAACRRYADSGAMGPGDALLAVASVDPRDTALHGGVCAGGRWAWLQ